MIDDQSPPGAWARSIAKTKEREQRNAEFAARNDRIRYRYARGERPDLIAIDEGVSVEFARRIGAAVNQW